MKRFSRTDDVSNHTPWQGDVDLETDEVSNHTPWQGDVDLEADVV
ncbi:hypothetical protein [Streptococcus pneumoniae]|nr:hypothetical protein [Streptococcus pneumoniae]